MALSFPQYLPSKGFEEISIAQYITNWEEEDRLFNKIEDFPKLKSAELIELKKQADSGSMTAQYEVFVSLRNSFEKLALHYLECAARQGSDVSLYTLGLYYEGGLGPNTPIPQSYAKAFQCYQLSASQNFCRAFCKLGFFYEFGIHVKQSYEMAFSYYLKAKERRDFEGTALAAMCYEEGIGVEQSKEKAKELYNVLMSPNPKWLSNAEIIGKFKPRTEYERIDCFFAARPAFLVYKEKANRNDLDAMEKLTELYALGIGTPYSDSQAFEWLIKASELGHKPSQDKLKRIFSDGELLFPWLKEPQDITDEQLLFLDRLPTLKTYKVTSENSLLGKVFKQENDILRAYDSYLIAANENDPFALFEIGKLYEFGVDAIKESRESALKCYEKSARLGLPHAIYALSAFYDDSDPEKLFYLKQASDNGILQAKIEYACNGGCSLSELEQDLGTGSARIQYLLAGYYQEKSPELAFHYYQLAAKQYNSFGILELGKCYHYGIGVARNFDLASECYLLATKLGVLEAYYHLGKLYTGVKPYSGSLSSLPRASLLAAYYFRIGAKYGDKDSQFEMGKIYEHCKLDIFNEGYEESLKKAICFYQLADDQNHTMARHRITECKRKLQAYEKENNAFALFRKEKEKADTENSTSSQYYVGRCYASGFLPKTKTRIEISLEKALHYFQLAAKQNHSGAMVEIGLIYLNIQDDIKQSSEIAFHCFNQAADLGDIKGIYFTGRCYELGKGVVQSYQEALRYYSLLLEKENIDAQRVGYYNLGRFYAFGLGVEPSQKTSQQYFKKSFEIGLKIDRPGNSAVKYLIAEQYENGWGVEKSLEDAFYYYYQAALEGYPLAIKAIKRCYEQGIGVDQSIEKANGLEEELQKTTTNEMSIFKANKITSQLAKKNIHPHNCLTSKGIASILTKVIDHTKSDQNLRNKLKNV